MNWNDRNYWNEDYFHDVADSINLGGFINHELNFNPVFQVGIWVIERVDLVLNEVADDQSESSLTISAIDALKSAFIAYPEFVSYHIQHSLGALAYSGVLNSSQLDIRNFWRWLYKVAEDDIWIKSLALHVLLDDDFSDKIQDVKFYSERGLNDYEIFQKIEQISHELNRTIMSADSLVELGILSNQPIA